MKTRVLVIAPHQDDEIIGCGGTIAKMISRGNVVSVLYILAGYSGIPKIKDRKRATRQREKEAIDSCKSLGIKNYFFLREKDRELVYNSETLKKMVGIFRKIRPNLVFIPHERESDAEHVAVSRISQEAIWIANSSYFPEWGEVDKWVYDAILFYEVWTPIEKPNYWENITDYAKKKIIALKKYKSQIAATNYTDAVLGLNRYRGVMSSAGGYAEAYLIQKLRDIKGKG